MLELLFELALEILGQLLFEIVAGFGWESLKDALRAERHATPLLAGVGDFLLGVVAGGVSLIVYGQRVTSASAVPGLSLVAAPIGTGIAMHWLGTFWRQRREDRPTLFTFRAGVIFAFAMALVRFVYLEH
jgi:hypothetical protein